MARASALCAQRAPTSGKIPAPVPHRQWSKGSLHPPLPADHNNVDFHRKSCGPFLMHNTVTKFAVPYPTAKRVLRMRPSATIRS